MTNTKISLITETNGSDIHHKRLNVCSAVVTNYSLRQSVVYRLGDDRLN